MRKADKFLLFVLGNLVLVGFMFLHAGLRTGTDLPLLHQQAQLVQRLGLTDLCLATEARHTRHPSQSDWHSAFQSHPGALDHFPSGSIIQPPETIIKGYEPPHQ